MDISGNGSIILSNESSSEAYVLNNGTNAKLNLQNINISTTGYACAIYNSGEVISSANEISSELACIYNSNEGMLNITGGKLIGKNLPASTIDNWGVTIIDSGNLNACLQNYGEFIVNNGNMEESSGIGVKNQGNMYVKGGFVEATIWTCEKGILNVENGKTSTIYVGKYLSSEATEAVANILGGETGRLMTYEEARSLFKYHGRILFYAAYYERYTEKPLNWWTASAYGINSVWICSGGSFSFSTTLYSGNSVYKYYQCGVRPVIIVPKSLIK